MADRVVYSTEGERAEICRACGAAPCACAEPALPAASHRVGVRRERSGRRGKTVTVAGPFRLAAADAAALLRTLKRACGGGGTVRGIGDGSVELEIQGDHVESVLARLGELGYPSKRSGG